MTFANASQSSDESTRLNREVETMTKPAELQSILDRLRPLWRYDPEAGMNTDDKIRGRILLLAALGKRNIRQLAAIALETDTWAECPRWR